MFTFALYFRPAELSSPARRIDRLVTFIEFLFGVQNAQTRFQAAGFHGMFHIAIVCVLIYPRLTLTY